MNSEYFTVEKAVGYQIKKSISAMSLSWLCPTCKTSEIVFIRKLDSDPEQFLEDDMKFIHKCPNCTELFISDIKFPYIYIRNDKPPKFVVYKITDH